MHVKQDAGPRRRKEFLMFSGAGVALGKFLTETFTANKTWIAPAGVQSVNMLGNGARGQDATSGQSYIYKTTTIYATRRSDGVRVTVSSSRNLEIFTNQSSGYCDLLSNTPSDPTYSSNQTCYGYDGYFTTTGNSPTTGTSATGLGQTFPGSYGNVAPSFTSKPGVTVTPAQSYSLVIPSGGSISLTYYKP